MRWLCFALLVAGGCATTAPVQEPGAPAHDTGERLIVDVASGEVLDRLRAAKLLLASRHVYVGETHGSASHHRVQQEVLETLRRAGGDLAVGIEWLPKSAQPAIDAWFAGAIDEADFLKQAHWKRNWGHDWKHYGPILRWARRHGVPVWALNADPAVARAVAKHGPRHLKPELKRRLPPLSTANDAHREFFRVQMERVKHGHHGHKGHQHQHKHQHKHKHQHRHRGHDREHGGLTKMQRYYLAQLVRDETMAMTVAERLATRPARTAVVLAGLGHIDHGHGVPLRVRKLIGSDFVIVLPIERGAIEDQAGLLGKTTYPAKRADLLWEAPRTGGLSARAEPSGGPGH